MHWYTTVAFIQQLMKTTDIQTPDLGQTRQTYNMAV